MKHPTVVAAACAALLVGGTCLFGLTARAAEQSAHDAQDLRVSTIPYRTPNVTLVREDGKSVSLASELDDGRPVVMNFIFTSCEGICPLMSQTFGSFQRSLGADAAKVHIVSISIDPEEDTPARLRDYAKRFHAGAGWTHYTGSLAASVATQEAFGVYRGDKMSHTAVTLMRSRPGEPWRRIDGFATPDDLVQQYRSLVAAR